MYRDADSKALTIPYAFNFHRTAIRPEAARQSAARPASVREQRLFAIRERVEEELATHQVAGTSYRFPENTRPNIVLLENAKGVRAYVLVGPQTAGVLPIGNDFLLSFDTGGKLRTVERLHNSYLAMSPPENTERIEAGMHSHLPAHPYITPTDICSLLLYQDAFPAPQHIVMGREYVSIFDIQKQQLLLLTKKAFDKIYKK
ncbi:hypothetical protein [Hymenobacter volaticus]|uniref:Uncharacterized protein n=1 Tax=Hymenobacter volaticus TaxID=2932254 RepID=A0ABY4G170_9BACT|nr:hypothetical protein [Hymenobacter volaticus]UOQ64511.1 hypothetical protein MUN86_13040 [Hymenobacter volaticus]